MSELVTKSVPQKQQKQKIETRSAMKRIAGFTIGAIAMVVLAVLGFTALFAQGQNKDKYSLISPGGIAFADFRGYEDWADVSSARTDEVLKVIVGNPTMINAYKPGWLHDRETSMEAKEEYGGPIPCGCPRRLHSGFRDGKGQQKIPENWRVGIRGVQLRSRIG
jgi:hypothetical protein